MYWEVLIVEQFVKCQGTGFTEYLWFVIGEISYIIKA